MDEEARTQNLEAVAAEYDLEYTKAIWDFGKFSIKAVFVMNGTAAVTMMTLITSVLFKNPELSFHLFKPVYYFVWGALTALTTVVPGYFAHIFCKEKELCDISGRINQVHIGASNKRINEVLTQYNKAENQEKKRQLSVKIIEEIEYQNNCEPVIKKNKADYEENKKTVNFLMITAIFCILSSFWFFIEGMKKTSISFANIYQYNIQSQIFYSDLSYPGVQITPLSVTKPN